MQRLLYFVLRTAHDFRKSCKLMSQYSCKFQWMAIPDCSTSLSNFKSFHLMQLGFQCADDKTSKTTSCPKTASVSGKKKNFNDSPLLALTHVWRRRERCVTEGILSCGATMLILFVDIAQVVCTNQLVRYVRCFGAPARAWKPVWEHRSLMERSASLTEGDPVTHFYFCDHRPRQATAGPLLYLFFLPHDNLSAFRCN